mgnify:CR=1 FL=1
MRAFAQALAELKEKGVKLIDQEPRIGAGGAKIAFYDNTKVISASDADVKNAPLAEMFGYSTTLRSVSQGRAVYSMQFSHYAEAPKTKVEEITSR